MGGGGAVCLATEHTDSLLTAGRTTLNRRNTANGPCVLGDPLCDRRKCVHVCVCDVSDNIQRGTWKCVGAGDSFCTVGLWTFLHKYHVSVFTDMINIANGLHFAGCIASLVSMLRARVCMCNGYILLGRWAHLHPHVHCWIHASSMCVCLCTGMLCPCMRVWACSVRIIHGSEWVKCGGRPQAAWSSARMEGPALIIKNTFTGRISAASVVGHSLQGHVQDNRTERKFGQKISQR